MFIFLREVATQKQISDIRTRLEEYKKHKSDPYSYFPEEIEAVGDLRANAANDIEFLLGIIDRIK